MLTALLALLVVYVLIDGYAQGGITLRNRQYVPMSEQPAVRIDLHWLMPLCYVILLVVLSLWRGWLWAAEGALIRVALFDPILNLRKRDSLFAVGSSGWLDKFLHILPWLSGALRIVSLAGAVAGGLFFLH